MLDIKRVLASAPRKPQAEELQPLSTPWGERIAEGNERAPEHPRSPHHPHPQFQRERFQLLDGWWEYSIVSPADAKTEWRDAMPPLSFNGRIRVPFSPEALLSGVSRQLLPTELLWYRRTLAEPTLEADERCILHFEAVDYACACYVNRSLAGTHVGGYLPFSFDVTDLLIGGENEIAVCVHDPSDEGVQLRGKQKLERGGIWYTAQSGIWQTVWLEVVPEQRIESLEIEAQADSGRLMLTVTATDGRPDSLSGRIEVPAVRLIDGDEEIACAFFDDAEKHVSETPGGFGAADGVQSGSPDVAGPAEAHFSPTVRAYSCAIDVPHPHLWSPEDPHLYRIELAFGRDAVSSYCAFRTVTMEEDACGVRRLCVNHEPCFLRGVLDQGYWPDGLMTAPSDEALAFDIQTCKNLGFNMLRKHIKIESDRWYYHCDRLGMLVWQDMVSGGSPLSSWHTSYKPTFFRSSWGRFDDTVPEHYRSLAAGDEAFRAEWTDTCEKAIAYLKNHPSIITWVLFNEGWGQFDAKTATELVSGLDPSRPIDAVSGWYDQGCGDFLSVHNYFRPLEVYEDRACPKRAFFISEFGGISFHLPAHSSLASSYGYETFSDLASFRAAATGTLAKADALEQRGLAGFVYTQLSDVEEETNGLLTYDRRVNKLADEDLS